MSWLLPCWSLEPRAPDSLVPAASGSSARGPRQAGLGAQRPIRATAGVEGLHGVWCGRREVVPSLTGEVCQGAGSVTLVSQLPVSLLLLHQPALGKKIVAVRWCATRP